MTAITRLLIANRGEIACAIIDAAREMGMATVAVYSDADAKALHVRQADQALRIGPAQARDSYLNIEAILAAARQSGADAIHPGYGFLSENAEFAQAVEAAGLIFVGPRPDSIRAMGMKDAAKRLVEKAGVPVVPGYHGEAQELVVLAGKANEIGYPVLIKAAAGGGGRGMRLVHEPKDFREALASAKREAKAAFGDDRVLVEKFIANPRHIEVQVFGDSHGNIVHLFERDCSLQRRHQKVIEEAPAPGMTAEMRDAMTSAAIKAARAIDYRGAGTVEFIVDGSGPLRPDGFWFMEMNTRLQVEHRVTEAVTGIKLIEWQLRVARGEALPLAQEAVSLNGHAVEARVYAEDPSRDFLPATGTLHHFAPATAVDWLDTGVESGDMVSSFYDPMIAKLVVHAADRTLALRRLGDALEATEIGGTVTNVGFLCALVSNQNVLAGQVDTGLIGRHQAALAQPPVPSSKDVALAALAAARLSQPSGTDPWDCLQSFRLYGAAVQVVRLHRDACTLDAAIATSGAQAKVTVDSAELAFPLPSPGDWPSGTARWPGHVTVFRDGHALDFAVPDPLADAENLGGATGRLTAPMPGLVKLVRVGVGDRVAKGQALLVLEAMKMEHTITAPHDGEIADIVAEGRQVSEGTVLVRFKGTE